MKIITSSAIGIMVLMGGISIASAGDNYSSQDQKTPVSASNSEKKDPATQGWGWGAGEAKKKKHDTRGFFDKLRKNGN